MFFRRSRPGWIRATEYKRFRESNTEDRCDNDLIVEFQIPLGAELHITQGLLLKVALRVKNQVRSLTAGKSKPPPMSLAVDRQDGIVRVNLGDYGHVFARSIRVWYRPRPMADSTACSRPCNSA